MLNIICLYQEAMGILMNCIDLDMCCVSHLHHQKKQVKDPELDEEELKKFQEVT